MCGCPEMESYEEFCLRTLAVLQEERKFKKTTCETLCSLKARSVIHFHGRAVLSPLLNAEQRSEMCGYRRKAVQLEADRQNQQRNELLARVQDILDHVQTHKELSDVVDKPPVSKSTTVSGYTLVTDSTGVPRDPGTGLQANDQPVSPCSEPLLLNGYKAAEEVKVESQEKSEEDEEDEEDISLDSLLKRSREYVKREQQGSKGVDTTTRTPLYETVCVEQEKSCSPVGDTGIEFGFSLHHSPVAPPQIQHPALYEPNAPRSVRLSPTLPEQYARLPSPESSISPRPRRRRPRPVSTGNIHISFPIDPADLIPRSPGRPAESCGIGDWGEARLSADHWGSVLNEGANISGIRRSSHSGSSPVQETCSPVSAPSPMGPYDHLTAGFRRRCHTLDSQLHSHHSGAEHIDRSQERVPRFMAGVTWLGPSRRSPAASPALLRSRVTPDLVTLRMDPDDSKGPNGGRKTPTVLRNTTDTQVSKTEETQWRAQALEDMQRRLEEEHALQMSLLLAEQEKEQQHLCLELEEAERRLNEQGCVRPLSADARGCRAVIDSCPVMSPSCPRLSPAHTPSERSPGSTIGFPCPVPSAVSSPSVQPPFMWGSNWTSSKPRTRLSLVLSADQQRAFCRVGAIVRGFLVRRLLKTDKVKNLCQTIVDTQEFIRSFQTEAPQKKGTYTAQDLSLQERVKAQLRAALYDIHDIFFELPLVDRLALLQQDRELRAERKLRDMVITKEKAKCPKEKVILSAATQRSLDRKKRVGDSPAQVSKMQQKPKSPTTNRVLKPSQGQNSNASGHLNRQGSWHRKIPEDRVRRSDSLKKQHSLG